MRKERPLSDFALLSLGAGVVTFGLKLAAWRMTGSVGLLSDALESLANIAAAIIALASLSVAARPEDEDHAYGHTKAEYFAGGVEGALIIVAAAGIGYNAVDRLFHPQALEHTGVGLGVAAVASMVNLAVARVLFRVAKKRHSIALEADAKHLMTDVWTSAAVILAVGLVAVTGWLWLDPVIGFLLAIHIVVTGARLVHESMLGLMDTGLGKEDLERLKAVLARFEPEGVHYHALRTREAGARRFMSVHLLMPGEWSIGRGHALADRMEAELRAAVPRLVVFTHMEPAEDPASFDDQRLDRDDAGPAPPVA